MVVLVRGKAELVSAAAEQKRAIQILSEYPQYDASMLVDDAPVLRITPVGVIAWEKIQSCLPKSQGYTFIIPRSCSSRASQRLSD